MHVKVYIFKLNQTNQRTQPTACWVYRRVNLLAKREVSKVTNPNSQFSEVRFARDGNVIRMMSMFATSVQFFFFFFWGQDI